MSKINTYIVFDSVAESTILMGTSKTDGLFIRSNLQLLTRINPNYEHDFVVYHIANYDEDSFQYENITPVKVSWDSYKRPEEKVN